MSPYAVPRWSWLTLSAIGAVAIIMGAAFVALRPGMVLLPEDQRFTGLPLERLRTDFPRLHDWIGMVFRSWGAFAMGLGVLIAGTAAGGLRGGDVWAWRTLALAGLVTFPVFALVNMAIGSDFRWLIVALGVLYAASLWSARPRSR